MQLLSMEAGEQGRLSGWTCRRTQVIHHQLLLVSLLDSNSFWTSGDISTLLVMNFSNSRMLPRLSSLPAYFSASKVCLFKRSACMHRYAPSGFYCRRIITAATRR